MFEETSHTTNLVLSDLMLTMNLMSLLLLLPLLWRPKPWSICLSLYSLLLGNKDLNGGILIPEPAVLILPHWWEKINKQSVVETIVIWAKLRTTAWKTASQITEELLRRSMVFSTVLTSYQNVERQTSQGYIPSGFGKKKKRACAQ